MDRILEVRVGRRSRPAGDRIVVGCFSGELPAVESLPLELRKAALRLARRQGWKAEDGQRAECEVGGGKARVLELVSWGRREELESHSLQAHLLRLAEEARVQGSRRPSIVLPAHRETEGEVAAARVLRALSLADYSFQRFQSKKRKRHLAWIEVLPPSGQERRYGAATATSAAAARGIVRARDLANTPPNEATPERMAAAARALARELNLRCTVLGPVQLARRGMGGILAVGEGSKNPPRLVRLELGRGAKTVALVGKGVTFDTGGISIKPAQAMDEMKYDKAGACTVLGILAAASELRLPVRLRAYLPLVENMPDGAAYRPGDIVRCANGKTVEITNTDAEGRMILADALSWAAAEKPDAIIEFSTLTGACVVALGQDGAGLFSPDDRLSQGLLEAAAEAGERLWRMPIWPEFLEEMKGTHADLKNSAGRWGGASTAAAFLSQFVEPVHSWAHLDIAGPAYVGSDGKPPRGATGFGIATTLAWLRSFAAS